MTRPGVKQKNGMLVRRVVGHRRLEGAQQLERLCRLYAALRLFTNIYQPSAKRIPFEESDRREGRRPRRRHDQPLTPADRLLRWSGISRQNRQSIEALQQQCDPADLLETIRWNQAALVKGESEASSESDRSASNQDLNAFLGSLRTLQRRMGEWRITHAEQVVGQQMGAIRGQENSNSTARSQCRPGIN